MKLKIIKAVIVQGATKKVGDVIDAEALKLKPWEVAELLGNKQAVKYVEPAVVELPVEPSEEETAKDKKGKK